MADKNKITGSRGIWADDEHTRFLEGLQMYPDGPWKAVADHVGTRTVRQVQTHAQKYHERAARRLRDLRQDRERLVQPEPMIDFEMKEICEALQRNRVPLSPRSAELQQRSMDRLAQASWIYFDDNSAPGHQMDMSSYFHPPAGNADAPSFDECIEFLIEALGSGSGDESGPP